MKNVLRGEQAAEPPSNMELSKYLRNQQDDRKESSSSSWAMAKAFEVIARQLCDNAGSTTPRTLVGRSVLGDGAGMGGHP